MLETNLHRLVVLETSLLYQGEDCVDAVICKL